MKKLVVLKAGAKTESFPVVLVPIFAVAGFIEKDDTTVNRAKWGGTKVEHAIEIFPRQDVGVEG